MAGNLSAIITAKIRNNPLRTKEKTVGNSK
jgi:hypothetical protein